jgi:hypothetical protein
MAQRLSGDTTLTMTALQDEPMMAAMVDQLTRGAGEALYHLKNTPVVPVPSLAESMMAPLHGIKKPERKNPQEGIRPLQEIRNLERGIKPLEKVVMVVMVTMPPQRVQIRIRLGKWWMGRQEKSMMALGDMLMMGGRLMRAQQEEAMRALLEALLEKSLQAIHMREDPLQDKRKKNMMAPLAMRMMADHSIELKEDLVIPLEKDRMLR